MGFLSVSRSISSKKAADERANGPSGPTEHARLTSKKRDDAEKAAHAVLEGRFASVQAALRSGEFDTSAKLAEKCLQLKRSQARVTRECGCEQCTSSGKTSACFSRQA